MQRLVVQLLQQLRGSRTTGDQMLQRFLLTGCCSWLHALCLESTAVVNRSVSVEFVFLLDIPHIIDDAVSDMSVCVVFVAILPISQKAGRQLYRPVYCTMLADFDIGDVSARVWYCKSKASEGSCKLSRQVL